MYSVSKDKWFLLPDLPNIDATLVSVPSHNELLAIGGYQIDMFNRVVIVAHVFKWNETKKKWVMRYFNMHTARTNSSCISHKSMVIVAGGLVGFDPFTLTRAVEVLMIEAGYLSGWFSSWKIVEQLPFGVFDAVSIIVDNSLYIAGGFDAPFHTTCNIVTASVPELEKSSNRNTSVSKVWNKLPDIPYPSYSISHYRGYLIVITAANQAKQYDIHTELQNFYLYNPDTESWEYIDCFQERHNWGGSLIHLTDDVVFVVGGSASTTYKRGVSHVKTCYKISFIG